MNLMMTDLAFHSMVHRMHLLEMADQLGRLAGLGSLSAEDRLRRLLWEFCALENGGISTSQGVRLNLPFGQMELAELVFTSREHVNRLLKGLQDHELIQREKGWIIVTNPALLRPRSDPSRH